MICPFCSALTTSPHDVADCVRCLKAARTLLGSEFDKARATIAGRDKQISNLRLTLKAEKTVHKSTARELRKTQGALESVARARDTLSREWTRLNAELRDERREKERRLAAVRRLAA
jgi:septal ring factor EnvC (AmiA/AmiB activator)